VAAAMRLPDPEAQSLDGMRLNINTGWVTVAQSPNHADPTCPYCHQEKWLSYRLHSNVS
jgi:hypothetical protein